MDVVKYYRTRFHAKLFPLKKCEIGNAESKTPLHKNWRNKEYTDKQLRRYLTRGHGLGWAIGPGVLVVDVDTPNDKKPNKVGDASFAKLIEDVGANFEDTVRVKSPAGGLHVYLWKRGDVAIRKTVSDTYPDVDFLTWGSYVVIAGSPHWLGGKYEFDGDPDSPVIMTPDSLTDAIKRPKVTRSELESAELSGSTLAPLLAVLDVEDYRTQIDWQNMLFACHDATAGSEAGLATFLEWSTGDPLYADAEKDIADRWRSLSIDTDGVTVATLLQAVKEADVKVFKSYTGERFFKDKPLPEFPDPTGVAGRDGLNFVWVDDLIEDYPEPNPPVIDGLIREAEVGNIVAATKVGKTWLAYGIAYAVANGLPWLDRFATTPGDVLYFDNELPKGVVADRTRWIRKEYNRANKITGPTPGRIAIEACRGLCWDIYDVAKYLKRITEASGPKRFKLIILDALYRFMPVGNDENSNGAAKDLMNLIDAMARNTQTAIVTILHSPKGDVSGRNVRDLHAGAGSYARAADLQVGIREHEEEDHFVLEAVNRSFKPVKPITVRRDMPLFTHTDIEPNVKLRETAQDERQKRRDTEGTDQVVEIVGEHGPISRSQISKRWSTSSRVNPERLRRLIQLAIEAGEIEVSHRAVPPRGQHEVEFYQLTGSGDPEVNALF